MSRTVLHRFGIAIALVATVSLTLTACGKKKKGSVPNAMDDASGMGSSDTGDAMGMETVNFDYDKYNLTSKAKQILKANADVLKDKASVNIQIEGHCDENGSIQYNLALGERRANAARKYLIGQGVSGARITTISFGKERPLDSSSNDDAWAKNRRANFVITSR